LLGLHWRVPAPVPRAPAATPSDDLTMSKTSVE